MDNCEIHVEQLIFEVTRRCNMECIHCLRGCSENIDMPVDMIDSVIGQLDEIGCINAGGGEPFLVPDITAHVFAARTNKLGAGGDFFVSTNGTISPLSETGVTILRSVRGYDCHEPDSERVSIQISNDQYHEYEGEVHPDWNVIVHTRTGQRNVVIWRGNAAENGIDDAADRDVEPVYINSVTLCEKGPIIEVGQIYISAKGHVYGDCDLSYEEMDEMARNNDSKYYGRAENLRETIIKMAAAKQKVA